MKFKKAITIGSIMTVAAVAPIGISGIGSANASIAPTSCSYTSTYHHATLKKSQTWTWKYKSGCGKNYTEHVHETERSDTGSHYIKDSYKKETYPHYNKHVHKVSWTKKGVKTVTDSWTKA